MKLFLKLNLGILFLALLALSSCQNPDIEIPPTCFDEIQNQGEERVDCGGPNCHPCLPSCDDGVQNQGEHSPVTDTNPNNVVAIDCGGENCEPCSTCDDGIQNAHWVKDINLTAANIGQPDVGQGAGGQLYRLVMEPGIDCGGTHPDTQDCLTASCYDGIHNGTETGIDCGDLDGFCPECPDPTCDDGIQNIHIEINPDSPQGYYVIIETGIDCDDKFYTSCPLCPLPTCFDGVQNGTETGIDCGGNCITLCDPEPNCNNGIQDGSETGVDCGGPNCPPCATCHDGIKNGPELAIDCLDYPITGFEDCDICPSCHDNIHNSDDDLLFELDVDCGGPNCAPCEQFVTVVSIGQGPAGGTTFRDQYSYNKILAAAGMTDTLSLDHSVYPGLQITRSVPGLSAPHLKIVANQGFALDANNTYIRTVIMYLPIPSLSPLNTTIPMINANAPNIFGYSGCLPLPPEVVTPLIGYQEKFIENTSAQKCYRSYIDGTENSTLTFTYNHGGPMYLGEYTKGEITGGSLRTSPGPINPDITYGHFSNLKFQIQHDFE